VQWEPSPTDSLLMSGPVTRSTSDVTLPDAIRALDYLLAHDSDLEPADGGTGVFAHRQPGTRPVVAATDGSHATMNVTAVDGREFTLMVTETAQATSPVGAPHGSGADVPPLLADRLLRVGEVTPADWRAVHMARPDRINTGVWARRALGVFAAMIGLVISICTAVAYAGPATVPFLGYVPMVLGLITLYCMTAEPLRDPKPEAATGSVVPHLA
jgi:hypothetical protein